MHHWVPHIQLAGKLTVGKLVNLAEGASPTGVCQVTDQQWKKEKPTRTKKKTSFTFHSRFLLMSPGDKHCIRYQRNMPWGGAIPVTQDKAIKSGFRAGKKKVTNHHDKY